MNILNSLSENQRYIVTSLPYRVGLMVSMSDDSGGEQADAKEREALDNIVMGFNGQVFGSELLQYIMAETVAQKDKWGDWTNTLSDVPEHCELAVDILYGYVDEKDVKVYITRLMEISEAVALAFKEYDGPVTLGEKIQMYVAYFKTKIHAKKAGEIVRSFDEFSYISPSERAALEKIAKALGTTYL